MSKQSGLGHRFYAARTGANGPAYNLSGDIGSIDTCDVPLATLDVTGIDKYAYERIAIQGDGKLAWTGFWNNAAGGGVAVAKPWMTHEVEAIWSMGSTEGVMGFAIVGLMTNFPISRPQNGSLTVKPMVESDAGDVDFGTIVANATDASGANHTGVNTIYRGRTLTITGITKANPAEITTSTAHGYSSNDSVHISGSNSTPVVNGDYAVTVTGTTTFTVPVDTSAGAVGTTGSVYKTSTRFGGRLYVLVLGIGSGNVAVKLQHSADGVTYNDISGMTTGNLNATTSSAVITATPSTQLWLGYLRAVSTGTFTNAQIVALAHRGTGARG